MAIKRTQWTADTCGCVIAYEWDTAVPSNMRTHTPFMSVRCPRHLAFVSLVAHYTQVDEESQRRNRTFGRLQSQFPALFDSTTGAFLGTWSFDSSHVLTVTAPGLTSQQKSAAQSWCDTNLGAGKVVVA